MLHNSLRDGQCFVENKNRIRFSASTPRCARFICGCPFFCFLRSLFLSRSGRRLFLVRFRGRLGTRLALLRSFHVLLLHLFLLQGILVLSLQYWFAPGTTSHKQDLLAIMNDLLPIFSFESFLADSPIAPWVSGKRGPKHEVPDSESISSVLSCHEKPLDGHASNSILN